MFAQLVKIARAAARRARANRCWETVPARVLAPALSCAALATLSGCGGTAGTQTAAGGASEASAAAAHFTRQQELVEEGGRLFVSDGCTGCHTLGTQSRFGPSFAHLAGSTVTLTNGHRVLVDERFLHAALLDPAANAVTGYSAAPMIAAVRRLKLAGQGEAVAALTAFIEQIGPENG